MADSFKEAVMFVVDRMWLAIPLQSDYQQQWENSFILVVSPLLLLMTEQVKQCLIVLLQHRIVSYTPHHGRHMAYHIDVDAVIDRVLFPRFIHMTKQAMGDVAEVIVEDILQHGQSTLDQSVVRVAQQLRESRMKGGNIEAEVKTHFDMLVHHSYLVKGGSKPFELSNKESVAQASAAKPGKRKRKKGSEDDNEEPVVKKLKSAEKETDDEVPPLWYVNQKLFSQKMRNESIVSMAADLIDSTAGSIMKTILDLPFSESPNEASQLSQVYPLKIMQCLPQPLNLSDSDLEQYLSLLVEEQLLNRRGDSSGGMYAVNFKQITELLCRATLESVVRERFGSKPLRIFRLLLLKQLLEQKQVSDMALVPNKEAKEILYSLLAENFVSLQEIPRSADYAPSRTFYLFFVNLQQVARMIVERSYKALGNLMVKRNQESSDNKRLLDKYQLWERQQMGGEAVAEESELEEALTPEERKTAERVKQTISQLEQGELQLVPTITTLQNYISFQ